MVFVFYQFNPSPLNFNPTATTTVLNSEFKEEYMLLQKKQEELEVEKRIAQNKFSTALDLKEYTAVKEAKNKIHAVNAKDSILRISAKNIIHKANEEEETNDKDYVFIHFIINHLPKGLLGLLLAVILSAAMSSTASELNALGTITALDLYQRNQTTKQTEKHYVTATKWFTLLWGCIAVCIACFANLFDNLIQLVNIIGSVFYGNILGVFLLAFSLIV